MSLKNPLTEYETPCLNILLLTKVESVHLTTFPTNPLVWGYIMLRRGYKSHEGAKIMKKLHNNGVIPCFTCLTFNHRHFWFLNKGVGLFLQFWALFCRSGGGKGSNQFSNPKKWIIREEGWVLDLIMIIMSFEKLGGFHHIETGPQILYTRATSRD